MFHMTILFKETTNINTELLLQNYNNIYFCVGS